MPSLYQRELPDSQESYISVASSTFSAPRLPSASSNLSTSTAGDTEITSPPSSKTSSAQKTPITHTIPPSPNRPRGPDTLRVDAAHAPRTGDTAASPMLLDSPATHGLKRAADGSVKGSNTTSSVPAMGHKRNKSMEAGSSGRIGQVRENHSKLGESLDTIHLRSAHVHRVPTFPDTSFKLLPTDCHDSYRHNSKPVFPTQWSKYRTIGRSSPLTSLKRGFRSRGHLTLFPIERPDRDRSLIHPRQLNAADAPAVFLKALTA